MSEADFMDRIDAAYSVVKGEAEEAITNRRSPANFEVRRLFDAVAALEVVHGETVRSLVRRLLAAQDETARLRLIVQHQAYLLHNSEPKKKGRVAARPVDQSTH